MSWLRGRLAKSVFHRVRQASLSIPRDGLVLDVGSGHRPHFRADVLCDRSIGPDYERGNSSLLADRPVVVGDVRALPFRDRAFDYVICRHLLEHIDEVELAVGELQRVGAAGFVETPSRVHELLMGRSYHRWLVSRQDGGLHFEGKAEPFAQPELARTFLPMWLHDTEWDRFVYSHYDLFFTTLEWSGELRCVVDRPAADGWADPGRRVEAAELMAILDADDRQPSGRLHSTAARWARDRVKERLRPRRSIDVLSLLACPTCQGPLSPKTAGTVCPALICEACRCQYPSRAGVFHLLADEAERLV